MLTIQFPALVQGQSFLQGGFVTTAHICDGHGEAQIGDGMVVAHATMHGGCQLASCLGQWLRPLSLAVQPRNEASLLFVEALVQHLDS